MATAWPLRHQRDFLSHLFLSNWNRPYFYLALKTKKMQHNLLISYLSSYSFFKITLSLSLHLSCLPFSLPLFLQTGDQCSAHLIKPEAPRALVSPVLKEELEQHTLLHTPIHTDPLKSINARLALVLADLIFWVNRAMQTWLSVRSHDNEQSLISPQRDHLL